MHKNIFFKNISEHSKILAKDKVNISKKGFIFKDYIIDCFKNDGKLIIFGNGGSAADAQHFSTEFFPSIK